MSSYGIDVPRNSIDFQLLVAKFVWSGLVGLQFMTRTASWFDKNGIISLNISSFSMLSRWERIRSSHAQLPDPGGGLSNATQSNKLCLVDSYVPGFVPVLLPLAWVTPTCAVIYCKNNSLTFLHSLINK